MENLIKWMGYIEAVNYDNRPAIFKHVGKGDLKFVCQKNAFDPRINVDIFSDLLTRAVEDGAKIQVEKVARRESKFINIVSIVEIKGLLFKATAGDPRRAIVNCLMKYVDYQVNK